MLLCAVQKLPVYIGVHMGPRVDWVVPVVGWLYHMHYPIWCFYRCFDPVFGEVECGTGYLELIYYRA